MRTRSADPCALATPRPRAPFVDFIPAGFLVLALLAPLALPYTVRAAAGEAVSVQVERLALGDHAPAVSAPVALRFDALGRHFKYTLEANDQLLSDRLRPAIVGRDGRHTVPAPVAWIGRGEDGSEARLSIVGEQVEGHLRTSSGTFVIEPDGSRSVATGAHTVRRAEDVLAEGGPVACGTADSEVAADPAAAASSRSVARIGETGTLRMLEVSVVADAEYYRQHGENSIGDLVALFNVVDGIYREQLGIGLQIVQLVVYRTADSQPFAPTTNYSLLLSTLSQARNLDPALSLGAGAVTHLLTGMTLDQGVRGLAWLGGVCDPAFGVGLTSVNDITNYLASIVVAHEIGHNLGAWHDGTAGSGCETAPADFVMSPILRRDLLDEFSSCSQARIVDELASVSCIGEAVSEDCGNGALDAGEDCDSTEPGDSGCCRSDCRLQAVGLPCAESGEECLDAVCNRYGECSLVANDASCAGGDVCMLGQCSDGVCESTGIAREFDAATATLRVNNDGTVESGKVSASSSIASLGGDPSQGGVTIRATMGGETVWAEFIPAESWTRRGVDKFDYRAATSSPGHVSFAKIRMDLASGQASYRLGFGRPMLATVPTPPSISVLAGDRNDGQCATSLLANCLRKGSRYRCE